MLIFFFFFASALAALHLYNEPKFMVIGNPVILEQSHAHNAPDLRDRVYLNQNVPLFISYNIPCVLDYEPLLLYGAMALISYINTIILSN